MNLPKSFVKANTVGGAGAETALGARKLAKLMKPMG